MQSSQEFNKSAIFYKVTGNQRLGAVLIFAVIVGIWWFLWLAGRDKFDFGLFFAPCSLKQSYGITCPTCGMTRSAIMFAGGDILGSFYIQPAGGVLYVITSISAFLALFVFVFGVNFSILQAWMARIRLKYVLIAGIGIVVVGWAVTLVRELAGLG